MKRSPASVQGAARIVAEFCAEHPDKVAQFIYLDEVQREPHTGQGELPDWS